MDDRYQEFEDYLRGTLSDTDRQQVEDHLRTPGGQRAFLSYRSIRAVIANRIGREEGETCLRKQLKLAQQRHNPPKVNRIPGKRIWFIAASICLMVVLTLFLYQNSRVSPESLLVEFMDERSLPGVRGDVELFAYPDAMLAYEKENWAEAARQFQQIPESSAVYLDAQLYSGYAWLKNKDYASAKKAFQRVFDASANPFQQENAAWHLTLIQILMETPDTADLLLAPYLADKDNPYHQRALKLDRKLDYIHSKQF